MLPKAVVRHISKWLSKHQPLDNTVRRILKALVKHQSVYTRFKPYTMVPNSIFLTNLKLVEQCKDVPGVVVECGTWKGGMIAGIAAVLKDSRRYYLFDSFQGLPPAKEIDGPRAIGWQSDATSSHYLDNCAADEKYAMEAMELSGAKDFRIVKGWFKESLLSFPPEEPIAILRLDGDWYDSTKECLDMLFPQVSSGGIIILDDYYAWDGCSMAIHDYLSDNQRPERILQSNNEVCFIVKV